MAKNLLYAMTALFDTPDEIIHAADAAAGAGYTRFDVHSPYPVHGMEKAMHLKDTRIGLVALAFGFFGAISAVAFMTWVTLVDYPLVIGGKPFWTWPAFVPVAFELTVLSVAVLTVLAMIVIYFRFPNTGHPLHDTPFMKRVSYDRFGLVIQADDPQFDEKGVTEFLRRQGGKEIGPVYFRPAPVGEEGRLFSRSFIWSLVVTALLVSGVTSASLNILMYLEPFSWMSNQPKLKPQSPSTLFKNGIGMRTPIEGTIARGLLPHALAGMPDTAGKDLRNPLLSTSQVLERGKRGFRTFCSPCHGNFAEGDSRLRGQFPNPPTLHSDKVRSWPDGNIYQIMTEGRNVMPSYASQIPRDERWAIVLYLRVLQRAQDPREADMR